MAPGDQFEEDAGPGLILVGIGDVVEVEEGWRAFRGKDRPTTSGRTCRVRPVPLRGQDRGGRPGASAPDRWSGRRRRGAPPRPERDPLSLIALQSVGRQVIALQSVGRQVIALQSVGRQVIALQSVGRQVIALQSVGRQVIALQSVGRQVIALQSVGRQVIALQSVGRQVIALQSPSGNCRAMDGAEDVRLAMSLIRAGIAPSRACKHALPGSGWRQDCRRHPASRLQPEPPPGRVAGMAVP